MRHHKKYSTLILSFLIESLTLLPFTVSAESLSDSSQAGNADVPTREKVYFSRGTGKSRFQIQGNSSTSDVFHLPNHNKKKQDLELKYSQAFSNNNQWKFVGRYRWNQIGQNKIKILTGSLETKLSPANRITLAATKQEENFYFLTWNYSGRNLKASVKYQVSENKENDSLTAGVNYLIHGISLFTRYEKFETRERTETGFTTSGKNSALSFTFNREVREGNTNRFAKIGTRIILGKQLSLTGDINIQEDRKNGIVNLNMKW